MSFANIIFAAICWLCSLIFGVIALWAFKRKDPMSRKLIDEFYWNDIEGQRDEKLTDAEKYRRIVSWAAKARGQNPGVFDALTEWVLDDSQWSEEKLAENKQILVQGVFARFKEQNAQLRVYLSELEPSGMVNAAVFKALDRFDDELSGAIHESGYSCTRGISWV